MKPTIDEIKEQYKLLKKAYCVDFSKIREGYMASGLSCAADSINEAKTLLLKNIKYEGWTLSNGDEITYINIPVIRDKENYLLEFRGKEMSAHNIQKILDDEARSEKLDEMLFDEKIQYFYIKKHGEYYRPNSCGYTSYKSYAGVYEKVDAISQARSCSELYLIPINIEVHNAELNKLIEEIKSRIIKKPELDGSFSMHELETVKGGVFDQNTCKEQISGEIPFECIKPNIDDVLGERETLIKAFAKIQELFDGREWLTESRGAYPYDDEKYKQEVRFILDEFKAIKNDVWRQIRSKSFKYKDMIIKSEDAFKYQLISDRMKNIIYSAYKKSMVGEDYKLIPDDNFEYFYKKLIK